MMTIPILALAIEKERDVVTARQRARQIAELLSFDHQDQVRIATAVSEIARNAFRYATRGRMQVSLEGQAAPQLLRIVVSDHGPGITNVDDVLSGRYRSATGMGLGLIGARRLMDHFALDSQPGGGTTVSMGKLLPRTKLTLESRQVTAVADQLAAERPRDILDEVERQNHELLLALDELRRRQEELERLNEELADTNRGVVALYAELDEKADHLRRGDEMKSKFLSNMSHEFRTPLNSVLALTRLLLDRTDGDLTTEQQRQVSLIRKAAQDLADLVNDLLDLAKVEAGKIVIRTADFEVSSLFGALRGMLRPLLVGESVNLVFEDPVNLPTLHTDEAKVSQILRNFISNALKFTERGEVRVSARVDPATAGCVTFSVSDTGIGVPPEEHERIFQEFTQLEHPMQKRVLGTGLGLPLSRKLAELLGGRLTLTSQPGLGSTFSAIVPVQYAGEPVAPVEARDASWAREPGRVPVPIPGDAADARLVEEMDRLESHLLPRRTVLLIDDDPAARYVLRRQFDSDWRVLEAANGAEGLRLARLERPSVIFLDLVMPGLSGAAVLQGLRADPSTIAIPVIIATSQHLQPAEQAELTANAATLFPKELLSSEHAATHVRDALARAGAKYSSSASSSAVNPIGR